MEELGGDNVVTMMITGSGTLVRSQVNEDGRMGRGKIVVQLCCGERKKQWEP